MLKLIFKNKRLNSVHPIGKAKVHKKSHSIFFCFDGCLGRPKPTLFGRKYANNLQLFMSYKSTSSFSIKKSRFDFADKFKVGDVRYKHLTQITIKVQLF